MRNVIIGVVVIVVVGTGGYFVYTRNQDGTKTIESSSVSKPQPNKSSSSQSETTSGNMNTLSMAGKAQKCTSEFGDVNGTGMGEGVLFTDGKGNALMTTTIHAKTETHTTNALVKGGTVYSWTDGGLGLMTPKKATQPKPSAPGSKAPTPPKGNSTLDKTYQFKCDAWTVDPSVFRVPSNIDFKTPQTMNYF